MDQEHFAAMQTRLDELGQRIEGLQAKHPPKEAELPAAAEPRDPLPLFQRWCRGLEIGLILGLCSSLIGIPFQVVRLFMEWCRDHDLTGLYVFSVVVYYVCVVLFVPLILYIMARELARAFKKWEATDPTAH
jgi:hypothetical protein